MKPCSWCTGQVSSGPPEEPHHKKGRSIERLYAPSTFICKCKCECEYKCKCKCLHTEHPTIHVIIDGAHNPSIERHFFYMRHFFYFFGIFASQMVIFCFSFRIRVLSLSSKSHSYLVFNLRDKLTLQEAFHFSNIFQFFIIWDIWDNLEQESTK